MSVVYFGLLQAENEVLEMKKKGQKRDKMSFCGPSSVRFCSSICPVLFQRVRTDVRTDVSTDTEDENGMKTGQKTGHWIVEIVKCRESVKGKKAV